MMVYLARCPRWCGLFAGSLRTFEPFLGFSSRDNLKSVASQPGTVRRDFLRLSTYVFMEWKVMGNALNGLLLLVCGATLWIVGSGIGAMLAILLGGSTKVFYELRWLGFVVMIGGPVVYWIVVPIRNRRKSRERRW